MTDRDFQTPEWSLPGLGKSIFPNFDVNVPMPRDTAIPGSYPSQRSPDTAPPRPLPTQKAAE